MKRIYLLLLLLNFNIFLTAQMLDPSFGSNGMAFTENLGTIFHLVPHENGQLLVSGITSDGVNGPYHVFLSRLNPDGSLDTAFENQGKIFTGIDLTEKPFGLKILQDGRILLGVNSSPSISSPQWTVNLICYNTDGSIDDTFGTNGKIQYPSDGTMYENGMDFTQFTDGKIFLLKKDFAATDLIKLNQDGSEDDSYGNSGTVILENGYNRISMMVNGDILLGIGSGVTAITKLHADGSIFTEFGDNGMTSFDLATSMVSFIPERMNKMEELPDGKILALNVTQSSQHGNSFIKLNADGSPDNDFGQNAVVSFNNVSPLFYCTDFITLPDGKILACGFKIIANYSYHFIVLRLMPNGSFDTDFGDGGFFDFDPTTGTDTPGSILMQDDGNLLVCGQAQSQPNGANSFCMSRIIFDNLNVNEVKNYTTIIYPNPFTDSFSLNNTDDAEISIFDSLGKTIMKKHINPQAQINCQFSSGIYFYTLTSANGEESHGKLIRK